jgi:hypothetical protein
MGALWIFIFFLWHFPPTHMAPPFYVLYRSLYYANVIYVYAQESGASQTGHLSYVQKLGEILVTPN